MYVIVEVPALCGVMAPVEASTVATPVLPLVHAPPISPSDVNVVEPFKQIDWVPLNVPASGAVVTVTSLVAVAFEQPPLPLTVYVIVDVPALCGVMAPVEASTVATPVLPLVHVPPLSPSDVNVVEPFEQIP